MPRGEHNSDRTNKRTRDQVQLDRAEMVHLLRRGWTKHAIAEKFGVHPSQISYDWKRVLTQVQDDMRDESNLAVAAQLERNAEVEREAWQAWEKSKQPTHRRVLEKRRRVRKVEPTGDGNTEEGDALVTEVVMEPEKDTATTEEKVGDPRFLTLVQNCQEVERDLKGLTPATRVTFGGSVDHNHQGAVGVGVFPWDALAGVAGAQALLGKGVDGRPVDPFGQAIAQALGVVGLPAPEGTTLPPPPVPTPPPVVEEPPPPPSPPPPPPPVVEEEPEPEAPAPRKRKAAPRKRKGKGSKGKKGSKGAK